MARIDFGTARQALRLINSRQYPESHYRNKRLTYSFWGPNSEAHDAGYQTNPNTGAQTREFLNQPSDLVNTARAAFRQISKFIDINFVEVADRGFKFSTNWRKRERGRIRMMTDGNGTSPGSSHGPDGGNSESGGETFLRPYEIGTRFEDVANGSATRKWWARDGFSNTNKSYHFVLHEIQHSLGLDHGHDNAGNSDNPHTRESDHPYNTIQSYTNFVDSNTVLATPMPDDILALQEIYGPRHLNQKSNIYTFKRSDLYESGRRSQQLLDNAFYEEEIANINTLDDSGGNDWLDFSDTKSVMHEDGVRVDMRPGGYIFGQQDWRDAGTIQSHNSTIDIEGVPSKGSRLSWRTQVENLLGTQAGPDTIIGNKLSNKVYTYGGDDFVQTFSGQDHIIAGSGADHVIGGADKDLILLGNGDRRADDQVDRIDYNTHSDSTRRSRDTVEGFGQKDIIDLNDLDGNLRASGRQNLTFIGQQPYSGRAGEVRAVGRSGMTVVRADLTGNKRSDFEILLGFGSIGSTELTNENFLLN